VRGTCADLLAGRDTHARRDLVDASIGASSACLLWTVTVGLALAGLVLFALLMISSQQGAAIGILVFFLVLAAAVAMYHTVMEHFLEGVDLRIDACKCVRLVFGPTGLCHQWRIGHFLDRCHLNVLMQAG
jgi:hypothetical protein